MIEMIRMMIRLNSPTNNHRIEMVYNILMKEYEAAIDMISPLEMSACQWRNPRCPAVYNQ